MRESHAHLYVTELHLLHVGVPRQEHKEFMDIIESYRSQVVTEPAAV